MADENKPVLTGEALEIAEKTAEAEGIQGDRTPAGMAVDEGDAAHQGGMGANGSAVDFEQPKNFAGVDNGGR